MSSSQIDPDSAVRVSVVPSQSSYFAGEQFSVSITFTNTKSADEPTKRTVSHGHKRGAHSISSVPLARPPTSPVTPRTALPALSTPRDGRGSSRIGRRGLIGPGRKSVDDTMGSEHIKKKLSSRSLSVSVSSQDLNAALAPLSARISPTVTRDSSLPLAATHPHARKHSVLDGQVQLHDIPTSSSPSPFPPSAAASTSAFSLSLDPISEVAPSAFPQTPSFPSPKPETHSYPPAPKSHSYPPLPVRHPTQSSLGHGLPPIPPAPPRTVFSSTFPQPNTELLLYSYAQLVGTLTVATPPGAAQTSAQTHALGALRGVLLQRQAVGGGSMDISSSLHAPRPPRRPHARSASLSSSLFALLAPPPPTPTLSWAPTHRARTPSLLPSFLAPSASAPALGGDADADTPLPVFDVPPAMLAVDLSLAPGESRTYTYTLPLPAHLPPTFRGRALRFSYQLVVGVCRAGGAGGGGSTSRVMKVPVRVYNNVVATGVQRPYDLLWPVSASKQDTLASVTEVRPGKGKGAVLAGPPRSSPSQSSGSIDSLRDYAERLLSAFPDPLSTGVRIKLPVEAVSPAGEQEREGELTGCREAVEILTRNPKKVSYDVNKDGVRVAVLTFVKSAYRLGETVLGVLELNERPNRARVLKLSALLEAHESLPPSLSAPSLSRHLRKVHAEHHTSLTTACLRTTFALDIPSDAAPAFQCDVRGPARDGAAGGGLEWKVRICLLVAVASAAAREGFDGLKVKHLVRDGPRGAWGSAWRAAGIAPLERPDPRKAHLAAPPTPPPPPTPGARGWASYLISSFLSGEREYHDGDEDSDGEDAPAGGGAYGDGLLDESGDVDIGGGEEGWGELRVETVECEVPIKVWPGNTAFKPLEVLFDV